MGITITGAQGTTYSAEEVQEYRRVHGDAALNARAAEEGFTTAQVAAALKTSPNDVVSLANQAQAKVVVNSPAEDEEHLQETESKLPIAITTPTGHTVTQQEAKEYVALMGYEQGYARAKELEMSNDDIATLLEVPVSEVDAFESQLRQKADKPSDVTHATDLSHPASDQQWWAQKLWQQPNNPEVSDKFIQETTKAILEEHVAAGSGPAAAGVQILQTMVLKDVPISQFVEAMKNEPGFTREAVEAFVVSVGLPEATQAWKQMIDKSQIMNMRLVLDQKGFEGLDGSGVKVWVLENNPGVHADVVSGVIGDESFGLAPGATVEQHYLFPGATDADAPDGTSEDPLPDLLRQNFAYEYSRLKLPEDQPGPHLDEATLIKLAFSRAVSNTAAEAAYGGITEQIINFAHSDARVLNVSMGMTFSHVLPSAVEVANELVFSSPDLFRAVFADTENVDSKQYMQQLTDFISDAVFNGSATTNAHRDYVNATQEAWQNDKVIVVSAGNHQATAREFEALGIKLPDVAVFNAMGMSKYVITVGASSTNGTPLTAADDTVAEFSSHGGDSYGVTVATEGTGIAVSYGQHVDWDGYVAGTSFSGPQVVAMGAIYFQLYPDATAEDFNNWLVSVAVDTAAPTEAEGAGILDMTRILAQLA